MYSHVSSSLHNIILIICSCGYFVWSCFCYRVIKLSSPYLNILIVIGAVLFYGDVILLGMDTGYVSETTANVFCMVRYMDLYTACNIIVRHISMLKVIPERLNSVK